MATLESTKAALAQSGGLKAQSSLDQLLQKVDIRKRFEQILGEKTAGFLSSILSLTQITPGLKACDPLAVLGCAAIAATLDLPINPNLGFAYIIPYGDKPSFQMGYKGFIQLAIRTNQYETIHASDVYEDELKEWDSLTGQFDKTPMDDRKQRKNGETNKIIGYVAYFQLLNGFKKFYYMTVDQLRRHGERYSKSFGSPAGRWKQDFGAMALKTVLKLLLSKYGILSIQMQEAMTVDQAVPSGLETTVSDLQYLDSPEASALGIKGPAREEVEFESPTDHP